MKAPSDMLLCTVSEILLVENKRWKFTYNKLAYFCIQSNLRLPQPLISDHLSSPFRVNIENLYFRTHKHFQNSTTLRIANTGADPGFFLGGGAPIRNGVTNTNKPIFFAEYQLYLSSLHPPPRSAPEIKISLFHVAV